MPEYERFELVSILPAFMLGPPLRTESFASAGQMKRLMEGEMRSISADHICIVDVRDCAEAHFLAIENYRADNMRFILCHSSPSFQEIYRPVANKYRRLGWPITEEMAEPDPLERINLFDNRASLELLGVRYTPIEKTTVDMADKMVELRMVYSEEAELAATV